MIIGKTKKFVDGTPRKLMITKILPFYRKHTSTRDDDGKSVTDVKFLVCRVLGGGAAAAYSFTSFSLSLARER